MTEQLVKQIVLLEEFLNLANKRGSFTLEESHMIVELLKNVGDELRQLEETPELSEESAD